jgi:O-antigen/teichoic acid export membrane protein
MDSLPYAWNRRNLIGNVAVLFSNSALSQGMTALALLLTARQLGSATFGQYAACFALTGILSVGFNLGLDIWLLREGGRAGAALAESVGSVFAIKLLFGAAWAGAVLLLAPWLNPDSFPPRLLVLSALAVWFDGLLATGLAAFKASLRNTYTLALESSTDGLWLAGTLVLAGIGAERAEPYIALRAAAMFAGLLASVALVRRAIGLRASLATARRFLRAAPPFASSEFLASAAARLDVTIVAFALGKGAVGLYSPAVSLVNALFLIPASIYLVMVPVLSKLFATDLPQARRTAWRFTLLIMAAGGGSFVLLLALANPLVSILGQSYRGTGSIVQILSAILFFKSISFAMAAVLIATGRQTQRVFVQAFAVALNAALNLLVVFWLGIHGVAGVYLLTEIVLAGGYFWLARPFLAGTRPASPGSEHVGLRRLSTENTENTEK